MVFILKQDNRELYRFETYNKALEWLHQHTSYSWYWAMTYEGYSIEEVKE